jgi:hypothetical protein
MLIATWIVTGILAAINVLAGGGKAFTPWSQLQEKMPWTETTGKGVAYLAAWSEVIGGVGAILPLILAHNLTDWEWAAWVSFAAAIGLAAVQLIAMGVHIKRSEGKAVPINLILAAIAVTSAILIAASR